MQPSIVHACQPTPDEGVSDRSAWPQVVIWVQVFGDTSVKNDNSKSTLFSYLIAEGLLLLTTNYRMANYFYYDSKGNQFGPISEAELKKKNLPPSTLVSTRGMKQCKTISEVFPEARQTFDTKVEQKHTSAERDIEEDRLYKQNVGLLIMIFVFFIPCTIGIELLTLPHFSEDIEPSGSGIGKLLMYVIEFGMKYWPIIAMICALICSIVGLNDKTERQNLLYTSFGICCATMVIGIIMIFNPQLALGIVFAIIVLLLIIGWVSGNKD